MKRIVRAGIFIGATAAVVVGGTLVSYASWILPDPGVAAKTQASAMPPGVKPEAELGGDKAVVTWKGQEIGGKRMTGYVVTAHDTDPTPLPSIARTVVASGESEQSATFTTAELAGGKWKWAITPKLQTWTGTEGELSNPKLVVAAPAPAAALAKAVAPVEAASTPTKEATTPVPAKKPEAVPATTTPAKDPAPEKSEIPNSTPTPSESSSDTAPSPSASASE